MPFKSEAQRKMMWSQHPEIAKKWAHGQHSTDHGPAVKRRLKNLGKKKKGGKGAEASKAPPWLNKGDGKAK